MSSNRRIQSSRLNGARSRGPVTLEGKQASAGHNFRHGMLARTVVLKGESEERFLALLHGLDAEFQPATEAEMALVESLAVSRWRQMRVWGIGKSTFDREMARLDPSLGPAPERAAIVFRDLSDGRSLDLIQRYETSYERQFSRTIKDLLQLQANRGETSVIASPTEGPTATWESDGEISGLNPVPNSDIIDPTEPQGPLAEPQNALPYSDGVGSLHPSLKAD